MLKTQSDAASPLVTVTSTFTVALSSTVTDSRGTKLLAVSSSTNQVFNVELSCTSGFATLMHCIACDYSAAVPDCALNSYENICTNGQLFSDRPCTTCPALSTTESGVQASSVNDCTCGASRYMSNAHVCEPKTCTAGNFNDLGKILVFCILCFMFGNKLTH